MSKEIVKAAMRFLKRADIFNPENICRDSIYFSYIF